MRNDTQKQKNTVHANLQYKTKSYTKKRSRGRYRYVIFSCISRAHVVYGENLHSPREFIHRTVISQTQRRPPTLSRAGRSSLTSARRKYGKALVFPEEFLAVASHPFAIFRPPSLTPFPLTTRPSRECPLENVHTRLIFESRIYYIHIIIIIIRAHRFEQDDPALNNNNNILLTCIITYTVYKVQLRVYSGGGVRPSPFISAHNY